MKLSLIIAITVLCASSAPAQTHSPKISDLNWARIYKIQGHRTDTIVHLSRNGDKASGTYQQKLTVEPQDLPPGPHINVNDFNKIYQFSGKVEEINGRIFIKNIQFTNSDTAFDTSFWHSPEGIRWIVGESAAYGREHRPTDALPGDEGLILTFVSDTEMQHTGEGPTFEKILSLVHVERLQSAANKTQTNDLKSLHTSVLNRWLVTKPEWRAATEQDYDKFVTDGYEKEHGPGAVPYYVAGDFNHDGVKDFAVILVNKKKPKEFAVVVFNGPFTKQNNEPAFFTNAVATKAIVLFDGALGVGPYATDVGFVLTPTKNGGYNLEYPKMEP